MKRFRQTSYGYLFIALLAAVCYGLHLYLLRHQVANIFTDPVSLKVMYASIGVASVFGYAVYLSFFFACFLFLTEKERLMPYLSQFLLYFIPLFLLLVLLWPGVFKGDEYYVLDAVRRYTLSSAQTGLTSLFYICALRFFPSLGSIPFFQILIISCIYAYVFKNLSELSGGKNPKGLVLLRIVFFLFPVLDADLFTLRASLVGWLFLLLLTGLYFAYKKQDLSWKTMILLSLLSGLIMAWRTEYLYLLVCLPAAFYILRKKMKKTDVRVFVTAGVILLSFLICRIPNKVADHGMNKYPISLVINPVSNILSQDVIKGEYAYDDVMTLNELIDVASFHKHSSVRNISQYWNIPDTLPKEQLNRFMKASFRLIFANFDRFLYYRWQTFAYTNGMVADDVNHPTAPTADTIYTLNYYGDDFRSRYYCCDSPFENVREGIINALNCRVYGKESVKTNVLYPVFYNALIPFVLSLLCLVFCLLKKRTIPAGLHALNLLQVPLVFLTAPAMFFMYYFAFYLCGYFLCALTVADAVSGNDGS